MKILVVSDSHGNESLLKELVKVYPNMDYYLHAGDSGLDRDTLYPFQSVLGNTDYFPFDEKIRVYTPIGYILIRHKPWFTPKEVQDNKILINGHTHQYKFYLDKDKVFLNHGSLTLPRDGTGGTFMIMNIEKEKSSIIIYDIETKNVLIDEQIV